MRELRPPVRPSALRLVLAIVLPLIVLVPMGALLALALGMTEASYTIAGGALVVRSGDLFVGQRTIRLADVTETRVVVLHGGRRTAGTALPGFCAGRFSYPDLGAVWQVTDCKGRALLVRGAGDTILITPPDPQGFADKIRSGAETVVTLPPPDTGPLRVLLLVLAPAAIITSLMVSAVLLLGPKRMRYLVGEGAFEVHTLFGRKRWPTAGARAKAYSPSRIRRVAGTAAPGYYTGIFRESGLTTRVYATEVERVVLFEGAQRVLVSPEDRVALLRALEEEGVEIQHHA